MGVLKNFGEIIKGGGGNLRCYGLSVFILMVMGKIV